MSISLRPPRLDDLPVLSALCMRSKAYWGYDDAFMAACREELTLSPQDLDHFAAVMAEIDGRPAGVALVGWDGPDAEIEKFFVDPAFMGRGVGRALFDWCTSTARAMHAPRLLIEADPQAAPFYEHMGAKAIGQVPSASIPGRSLPHLALALG